MKDFIIHVRDGLVFLEQMDLVDPYDVLTETGLNVSQSFLSLKQAIDLALYDNIDLPSVMRHLRMRITFTKEYIEVDEKIYVHLVQNIYSYVLHFVEIFGLKELM